MSILNCLMGCVNTVQACVCLCLQVHLAASQPGSIVSGAALPLWEWDWVVNPTGFVKYNMVNLTLFIHNELTHPQTKYKR